MDASPFRFRFRVRYGECDAQKIVFNARWADYIDIAATEYTRVLFGGVDLAGAGIDWRLVRQLIEWKAPARFDDVLQAALTTARVGTTSFTLASIFTRWADGAVLATAETVYVVVDPALDRALRVPDRHRAALEAGARGLIIDHAGTHMVAAPA